MRPSEAISVTQHTYNTMAYPMEEPQPTRQLSASIELEGLLIFTDSLLHEVLPEQKAIRTTGLTDHGAPLPERIFKSNWAIEVLDKEGKLHHLDNFSDNEPQKLGMVLLDNAVYSKTGEHSERVDTSAEPATRNDRSSANVNESAGAQHRRSFVPKNWQENEKFVSELGWMLKREYTVYPIKRSEKVERGLHPDVWETIDIEFVSKVYLCDDSGIRAMTQDVDTLVQKLTTPRSFIYYTKSCGMHVHIGYADSTRFPIRALRIMAFILLVFEHEISRLYELHRHGERISTSWIQSNLARFESTLLTNCSSTDRDYKYDRNGLIGMRSKYVSIAKLRETFLDDESEGDNAYTELKKMLSPDKGFVVNYQNIDGDVHIPRGKQGPVPCTVEFRQPEATFGSEAIGHVVTVYGALVHLALQFAESGQEVFPIIQRWDDTIELRDLLESMQLPEATEKFLGARLVSCERQSEEMYWEECDQNGKREDDQELLAFADDDDEYGEEMNWE